MCPNKKTFQVNKIVEQCQKVHNLFILEEKSMNLLLLGIQNDTANYNLQTYINSGNITCLLTERVPQYFHLHFT